MPETLILDATHERILQWLRHYPFQRLEDLTIALGIWSRRTTIYTHLKDLEQAQLIETLKTRMDSGACLYHLAPSGLLWCLAQWENNGEPQAASSSQNVQTRQETLAAERAALLRLVPRIPVLLTLQTAINGLVSGAAHALTRQGHHASLVRWNWQRDVVYHFTFQGYPLRWFADGVGAFCLRFASNEGVAQEDWYRFFLLSTPITHLHLMRARLDRLLRWRESQERWSAYTQMPPILILAATPRQAEWWHEAAERVTHDLEVKRPLGVVATLPRIGTNRMPAMPLWELTWKHLGTESLCHLQEVFLPQNDPDFPDLFPQETRTQVREGERLPVQATQKLARTRQYRYRFATLAQRQNKKHDQSDHQADWRLLSLTLASRQWEILALLLDHPLLDRADLCAHLQLVRSSLRHLLAPLEKAGMIENNSTTVGERFALAENGLRLMAAASRCHVRYLVHRPGTTGVTESTSENPGASLIPRGVPGLRKQIEHIAGVYGFCAVLTNTGSLRWWETGSLCARFYMYQGDWHGIRPDVIAECQSVERIEDQNEGPISPLPTRTWRFFLEWDRGTMRERDLQRKLTSYAFYYTSREWAREHRVPPTLLFVAPDIGQERRLTRIALTKLRGCSTRVTLYTTTRGLLAMYGIAASIWRPVLPLPPPDTPDGQATVSLPARLALFPRGPNEQVGSHNIPC